MIERGNQELTNNLWQASKHPMNSVRERLEAKFKPRIHEDLRLRSAVSYVGNKNVPFLRIYRYKEAFALNLVKDFLKRFKQILAIMYLIHFQAWEQRSSPLCY